MEQQNESSSLEKAIESAGKRKQAAIKSFRLAATAATAGLMSLSVSVLLGIYSSEKLFLAGDPWWFRAGCAVLYSSIAAIGVGSTFNAMKKLTDYRCERSHELRLREKLPDLKP